MSFTVVSGLRLSTSLASAWWKSYRMVVVTVHFPQLQIQSRHVGSLKLAVGGLFTLWNSVNADQGFFLQVLVG